MDRIEINNERGYQENSNTTGILLSLGMFIAIAMGLTLWFRYDSFIIAAIMTALSIGGIYVIDKNVNGRTLRSLILLAINIVLVLIISFPVGEVSQYSSTNSPEGVNLYCEKHQRAYNTGNAWGGCPDCKDEEWDRTVEKSRQHLIKKYK